MKDLGQRVLSRGQRSGLLVNTARLRVEASEVVCELLQFSTSVVLIDKNCPDTSELVKPTNFQPRSISTSQLSALCMRLNCGVLGQASNLVCEFPQLRCV